jgi:ABC-type uncharacterized transport system permease subunit
MNAEGSRLLEIGILAFLMLSPIAIWLALYIAAQKSPFNSGLFLTCLKKLRGIAYVCGIALILSHFTSAHFFHDFNYGGAVLTFSAGLSIPESLLKKQVDRI